MKSGLPKVLHRLAGQPMIGHLLDILSGLGAARAVVVVGAGGEQVTEAVQTMSDLAVECAVQEPQLGTAHAVLAARDVLANFEGDVLVLYGDAPLVREETLETGLPVRQLLFLGSGPKIAPNMAAW